MNYAYVRPQIRSGDILAFSHGDWRTLNGIKVNLVRIFTRSTYSHVGVAWVVGGRIFIIEAVEPMTRIFPLSLSGDFYLIQMNTLWFPATEEYALSKIGVEYLQLQAIRAFFRPLSPGSVCECAAYVREILLRDNIDLGALSRPDTVVLNAMKYGAKLSFVSNPLVKT